MGLVVFSNVIIPREAIGLKGISVIYWSGTGNTKQMAEAIAEGARREGAEVVLVPVSEATKADVAIADGIALGCPAMGDEALEETEMEPFVSSFEKDGLKGKPLALFGSYDWGDGQWMREWVTRMQACRGQLVNEGLIVRNAPDEAGLDKCRELGARLVAALR
jgi:flavodoxin I